MSSPCFILLSFTVLIISQSFIRKVCLRVSDTNAFLSLKDYIAEAETTLGVVQDVKVDREAVIAVAFKLFEKDKDLEKEKALAMVKIDKELDIANLRRAQLEIMNKDKEFTIAEKDKELTLALAEKENQMKQFDLLNAYMLDTISVFSQSTFFERFFRRFIYQFKKNPECVKLLRDHTSESQLNEFKKVEPRMSVIKSILLIPVIKDKYWTMMKYSNDLEFPSTASLNSYVFDVTIREFSCNYPVIHSLILSNEFKGTSDYTFFTTLADKFDMPIIEYDVDDAAACRKANGGDI